MESNKRRGRVDLFISNSKLRGDCMDVAQMMRKLGINCNITANKSVLLDEKVFYIYSKLTNYCKDSFGLSNLK